LSESDSTTKWCSKCDRTLPATTEFFYPRSDGTGLRSQCKSCLNASVSAWRAEHPEKVAEYGRKPRKHRKPNPEKRATYMRKYRAEHSAEWAAYRREWRIKHPNEFRTYYANNVDRYAALNREWRSRNKDRTAAYDNNRRSRELGNGGSHTADDIQAQYDRQNGRCFYCGRKVGDKYHRDHVIPLSKGGSNGPENLVVACPTCNLSKHDNHPMDFCGRLL
jgi:5-methylcytosine-specific restriction endonuclease McrA